MNKPRSGEWRPDPSGKHRLRWRDADGSWTQYVSEGYEASIGRYETSIDPLFPAAPPDDPAALPDEPLAHKPPITRDLASCPKRVIAYLIDLAAVWAPAIFLTSLTEGGNDEPVATPIGIAFLAWLVFVLVNMVVLPAWRGLSVGKWLTGIRLEPMEERRGPGVGPLLLRLIVLCIPVLPVLAIPFNPRRRGWHDRASSTVMAKRARSGLDGAW